MTLKINLILIVSKNSKTLWKKPIPKYTNTTKFYKETVNKMMIKKYSVPRLHLEKEFYQKNYQKEEGQGNLKVTGKMTFMK